MENDLNWSLILHALSYRIQDLHEKIILCDNCKDYKDYKDKLDNLKSEWLEYKNEYRNVLIAQQKSNK